MPVKIHGNQYVTVVERMEMMRQSEKPFEIVESMPIQVGDRCVWRVAIMLGDFKFYGSAECHFNAKPGTADATDPFACAETSAIGRALGFAGYGSVDSIASADEVVRNQEPKPVLQTVPAQPQAQEAHSEEVPVPSKLRALFVSIGTTLETAEKLTFKRVKNDLELTPEECSQLHQVYNAWKLRYDAKQQKAS